VAALFLSRLSGVSSWAGSIAGAAANTAKKAAVSIPLGIFI
jgi:hypothetical protein